MSDIIYPTLRLFIYDLRDGLGFNNSQITQKREFFQQKLPKHLGYSISKNDVSFDADYVELLGKKRIQRFYETQQDYEGYYYPVRLHDTYGLLLDCSVRSKKKLYKANCYKKLKLEIGKKLEPQSDKENQFNFTLGQSWMLLACLPENNTQNPVDIAKESYKAVIPDGKWEKDFQGKGHFLGGIVFECWRYNLKLQSQSKDTPLNLQDIQENHHVIIALFPNMQMLKKAAEFNFDWLRLFSYRSKIMWAYAQSLVLKQNLKEEFKVIQTYIQDLRGDKSRVLSNRKLKHILDDARISMSEYAINYTYLRTQARTLDTNICNYRKILNIIAEESHQEFCIRIKNNNKCTFSSLVTDFNVLQNFWKTASDRYLLQVKKDCDDLRAGLELLEIVIETIQATVTIRQAESERIFNKNIQTWGWGLAVASIFTSIVASSFGEFNSPLNNYLPLKEKLIELLSQFNLSNDWLIPAHIFVFSVVSFVISLGVVLGIWFLLAKIFQLLKYLLRRTRKR
ncbi:MAG: hypothetical protein VKN72_22365 [Nostocales cyanobacterium 94392]|nr:hypothetical protein [Nostocales cyanobacterium 94392]